MADIAYFGFGSHGLILFWLVSLDLLLSPDLGLAHTVASFLRSQLIGKDSDVGKDWRQKEKEESVDEMVR